MQFTHHHTNAHTNTHKKTGACPTPRFACMGPELIWTRGLQMSGRGSPEREKTCRPAAASPDHSLGLCMKRCLMSQPTHPPCCSGQHVRWYAPALHV